MTDFSYLRRQEISECRPDDIWRKIVSQTCERVIFQELVKVATASVGCTGTS
jgi:hypothetical protein